MRRRGPRRRADVCAPRRPLRCDGARHHPAALPAEGGVAGGGRGRRRHRRPLSHRRPRRQRHLRGRRLRVLRRHLAAGPRRLLSPPRAPGPSSLNTLGLRLLPGAVLIAATVALLTVPALAPLAMWLLPAYPLVVAMRSEEHTSELQSHLNLVCRLLLEKKNQHESR